jgi:O-antigen biosynthesis protein
MELQELYEQITNDPNKGELYIQMGDEYLKTNINQAYLCYEQASSLCSGDEYSEAINKMNSCRLSKDFYVHSTSFVILSYNSKDIMIECLEAIRNTCTKGSFEVIVVDSNSTDGIREWLKEQKDIKLILNDKFDGFAAGCNQGAKIAEHNNDIYLLNNDAIVTPRSLFYMRLALYSKEKIGAVGPVSSNVGEENLYDKVQRSHDEWMKLSESINHPSSNPIQYSHWLQGHALLIKRRVWDEVGMMDTDFKFGGYEDTEYGIRLGLLGFQLAVCKNSFVYHYGHTSMKKKAKEFDRALVINQIIFEKKLNVLLDDVLESKNYKAATFVNVEKNKHLNILQIYGGCANVLNLIKYNHPDSTLYSIQNNPILAKVASNYSDSFCLDLNKDLLPFKKECFDYIFFFEIENVDHLKQVLFNLKDFLKSDGHLIVCGNNTNHISVIDSLIHGSMNAPLINKLKHYYTTDDIRNIVNLCGFVIPRMSWTYQSVFTNLSESQKDTLNKILSMENTKDKNTYVHTSVLIDAVKG